MSLFNYECDETRRIIEEASPNYPQLTTYEKEWMYFHKYGYMPGIPVELEYETVNIYPSATVLNAIPHQYKSAILKGQTLVNVHPTNYIVAGSNPTFYLSKIIPKTMIKPNTRYFLRLYNTHQSVVSAYFKPCVKNRVDLISSDNKCAIFTTKSEFANSDFNNNKIHFYSSSNLTLEDVKDTKVILCEYVDGMENWDIPYFEGMKSVQMPVLTTSNEDGTKTNILTVNDDITLRSNGDVYDELNLLTGRLTQRIDENNEVLSQEVVKTVDLTPLNNPYEGTNHYQLTANIPCEAVLEVPVVSTGKQTLKEING